MSLTLLDIHHLRNLESVRISPESRFNVFYGNNGSGKTSILEAIYYLALGKSFRSRLNARIARIGSDHFRLLAKIQRDDQSLHVGIERHLNGDSHLRINQQNARSLLEVTQALPIRLLYTDSRLLLSGPAKLRRQFIDWGVFHVEHSFLSHWQHAQRALKQRNAALRSRVSRSIIELWNIELIAAAELLNPLREQYVCQFSDVFEKIVSSLLPGIPISLTYKPGWNTQISLEQLFAQSFSRDLDLGYTQYGPQKADLSIRVDKTLPAQDVLSQGQQKLLVYALYLSQGVYLKNILQKSCIYLLDDLPAELDAQNRLRVTQVLCEIQAQVFVTGVNKEEVWGLNYPQQSKMFHVEQGRVTEQTGASMSGRTVPLK